MPLYGLRESEAFLDYAPEMERLDVEPLTLPRAEVLQVMFEIDDQWMQRLLPAALHPTIPPSVTFVLWRCPESKWGPFEMAQVRVGCRAGVRPRGFPLITWCDSDRASDALRSGWGFNCRPGQVRLKRSHDRIVGTVSTGERLVLQVSLVDPQPISGADVQYVANMHMARVREGAALVPRLVQVDPEFVMHRADRGQPVVDHFEREPSTGGVIPVYPVSASCTVCDITLPRLRYLTDPDRPAIQGTQTIAAAS